MIQFTPRPEQAECLEVLEESRRLGRNKALVVMASGLGKTALAAFDVQAFQKTRRKRIKIMYLCHQTDILRQARKTFEEILGESYSYGYFHGGEKNPSADILFSSFQTMGTHLGNFARDAFDYLIVDESHHSQAPTYRPVLDYFLPDFTLAPTATPDRADLKDIRLIYGTEVFSFPLEKAVAARRLAQVDYRLLTDEVQNLSVLETPIGQLSIKLLNRLIFIPKRDDEIVQIIKDKTKHIINPRMAIFCQSIDYIEKRLAPLMPEALPLHSDLPQREYQQRLEKYRKGHAPAVLTVDMLNEGIDVPETNVLVFLRSTQSLRIFLQQLGRGLRLIEGKDSVLVLDFVANCERLEMVHQLWKKVQELQKELSPHDSVGSEEHMSIDIGNIQFDEVSLKILEVIKGVRSGYTKEILVKYLQDLGHELHRTPKFIDVDERSRQGKMPNISTFAAYFGTFRSALQEAGFKVKKTTDRNISKEELLDILRCLSLELEKTPTIEDLNEGSKQGTTPSASKYIVEFGTFTKALVLAGISPSTVFYKDENAMLEKLKELGKKLGHRPSSSEVVQARKSDPTMPSSGTYRLRFGSFNEALRRVGYELDEKKILVEQLKALALELDRIPSMKDIIEGSKRKVCGSYSKYRNYFGSYEKILAAADLSIEKEGRCKR
jgi:superfamily II DNA or RNA helicase